MAREDDGGGAADAPELDASFLRVGPAIACAIRLGGAHDLGVG